MAADTLPFETDPDAVELDGTLTYVTFRNEKNGYTVGKLAPEDGSSNLTVVGMMPGIETGDTVRLRGRWTKHATYGKQIAVETCELRLPTGRRGLVRFLGGGRIKGVGTKTAEAIVDALGLDVLDKLESNPALLSGVPGIGKARAHAIAQQLHEQRAASGAFVFLGEHGLGPGLARRVFDTYGSETAKVVTTNPYRLADEVDGIGFQIADRVALSLGLEHDSASRVSAGLRFLLGRATLDGHVGLPNEDLIRRAAPFLEVDEQRVESVLQDALAAGELVDEDLVYRPDLLAHEKRVAAAVSDRLADPLPLVDVEPGAAVAEAEQRQGIELSPDQREALRVALCAQISVITGGPGVGKTTIIRCLVDILDRQGLQVALAAPTGRAARRLGDATGWDAATLHRLLGLIPTENGMRSVREEPFRADVLVVDEMSMVDVSLMAAVAEHIPPRCALVLVGDVDQLPPVGPGEVLRDLIRCRAVPVARVTTIFRQDDTGGIVRVAHELNEGRVPEFDQGPTGQAFFVERTDAAAAVEAIRTIVVDRIPSAFGFDPLEDIQVITPMHNGPLGTVALNECLRESLNPPAEDKPELERFGRTFRTGDKVMQVRNNYDLLVFNGDIGRLVEVDVDDDSVTISFDGRLVRYDIDQLDQLDPAFAITCHKSQGSEFPAIVLPLTTSHWMMLRRNLVYTAFTRARRVLVAVGEPRALATAASTPGAGERHGRLAERITAP